MKLIIINIIFLITNGVSSQIVYDNGSIRYFNVKENNEVVRNFTLPAGATLVTNCDSVGYTSEIIYSFALNNISKLNEIYEKKDIYISASGNDSNDGSYDRPIKTLAELNSRLINPNTTVYFNSSDIFTGELICSSGTPSYPITYTSYGIGKKPTLSGNYSGIYEAITLDSIATVINDSSFISNLTGDFAHIRTNSFQWEKIRIFSITNDTVVLVNKPNDNIDSLNSYFFTKEDNTPSEVGISIYNNYSVIVDGIAIENYTSGINIEDSEGVTIKNCEIQKCREYAINTYKSNNLNIENCKINNIAGNGINVMECDDIDIIDCTISSIGLIDGLGVYGAHANVGVFAGITSWKVNVYNNNIDSVGYSGILLRSKLNWIENNNVSNYCYVKTDGGGVYTNNTIGTLTRYNYVYSQGYPHRNTGYTDAVVGIYSDDFSEKTECENNTVDMSNNKYGIYVRHPVEVNIKNNTITGGQLATRTFSLKRDNYSFKMSGNYVDSNDLEPLWIFNDIPVNMSYSNNSYYTTSDYAVNKWNLKKSFEDWKDEGLDINSKFNDKY